MITLLLAKVEELIRGNDKGQQTSAQAQVYYHEAVPFRSHQCRNIYYYNSKETQEDDIRESDRAHVAAETVRH